MAFRQSKVRQCCRSVICLLSLVVAIMLIGSPLARAELVRGLYEGHATIQSQSASERKSAAQTLLAEVLVKVSGQSTVLANALIKQSLRKADIYIQEYSYSANTVNIIFSQTAVEDLLRQAGMPLWSTNRPSLLIWLMVEEEQGGRYLVNDSDRTGVYDELTQAAQNRGLPLIVPLFDLEDQTEVSEDDVWDLNQSVVQKTARRYNADAVLLGRINRGSSGLWKSTWILLQGEAITYEDTAGSLSNAVAHGMNYIADSIVQHYAIAPTQKGGANDLVLLQVDGIDSFAKYAALNNYLGKLAPVRNFTIVELQGEKVFLTLKTEGQIEQLREAIALDKKFTPLAEETIAPETLPAEDSTAETLPTENGAATATTTLPPSVQHLSQQHLHYAWTK